MAIIITGAAGFIGAHVARQVLAREESDWFRAQGPRVTLTREGRLFRDYATETLRGWDGLRQQLQQDRDTLRGELSLYCSVTASYSFLYDILSSFRQNYPRIEMKLHTGDPGSAGTANAATETTRQAVTFGSAAASGSIANTVAVSWTNVSTTETVTWVSFWTASSAGTFLGSDDLSSSAALTAGDTLTIAISGLTLSIT